MKSWLAMLGSFLIACGVTFASGPVEARGAAETGGAGNFSYQSSASLALSDTEGLLRPYGLDIGRTVVLRGLFHCPLYADFCVVVGGTARHGSEDERRVKVSLATLSPERRSYLMSLCGLQAGKCRDATVTGRVVGGINEPIVMAVRVRIDGP